MASMDVSAGDSGHKKGPGVKKAKKLSTRVDMTPMVDLGFLLITFFIFTTTMSTPATMKLIMPKDDKNIKDKTEIKESDALTILMGKGNQIYYYMGQIKPDGSNFTSSNLTDIRKVISDKKKEVMIQGKSLGYPADTLDKDFVVVIKPNKEASYKSVVDILDEMTINGVHRFALVDITDDENKLVKATESRNGIK
jgi:biopolymer transport protein ExbD